MAILEDQNHSHAPSSPSIPCSGQSLGTHQFLYNICVVSDERNTETWGPKLLWRGRGKGWLGYTTGSALAATCKTMVLARFPENKVPWCSSSVCRWQWLLGQKGNCPLALLARQQDLQYFCGSVWAGQVRNLQGRHRGALLPFIPPGVLDLSSFHPFG